MSHRSHNSHNNVDVDLVHSQIQEITAKIEQLRNESTPLRIVKAGYIEEKLAGFVKDLKQHVDNTQVRPSIVCGPFFRC